MLILHVRYISLQVQLDQGLSRHNEKSGRQQRQQRADQHLEPEGVADTVLVIGAVKLGGENACTGACALLCLEGEGILRGG